MTSPRRRAKTPGLMRTFGGFLSDGARVYGEVRGEEVHLLTRPFWLGLDFSGEMRSLGELTVASSGGAEQGHRGRPELRDHIKEMQRTEIGSPLIWFKAPSSLLPHEGTIRDRASRSTKPISRPSWRSSSAGRRRTSRSSARSITSSVTRLRKTSAIAICRNRKSNFRAARVFDTYTPVGPFVYTEVDTADLEISLEQNGEVRQKARTSQMIYPVARDYFFRQPSAHSFAGRFDPDRHALGRRPDPRRGRIGRAHRRLAGAAKFRRGGERLKKKTCLRSNLLGFALHPTVKVNPNYITTPHESLPHQH